MKNIILSLLICTTAFASEPEAEALAIAGAAAASKGKIDVAEGLLYRALTKDQNCATALYELGKIEHGRKSSVAFDFLRKAMPMLEAEGKSAAVADAKRRLSSDPVSAALQSAMDAYSADLKKIAVKCDAMTASEIQDRSDAFKLNITVEAFDPTAPVGVKVGSATMFDVTELKIVSSKVGYAELGVNRSPDDVHFPKIKGVIPKKYLSAVAPASIVYNIPSGCIKFECIGLRADDLNGSIKLIVKIDGKQVYASPDLSKMSELAAISVQIPAGSKTLELIADPNGSIVNDYACWCEPKFWKK